jgi:hypothetical protein
VTRKRARPGARRSPSLIQRSSSLSTKAAPTRP